MSGRYAMGLLICLSFYSFLLLNTGNGMLYENVPGIQILSADNFDDVIFKSDSKNIWLTQYYAHWCGTCQNFVPKWLKVVENVQHWSPIVRVGALDCGNSANVATCRKHDVAGYPTVRLYWPSVLGRAHHDFGFLAPLNLDDIMKGISQTVVSLLTNGTFVRKLPPVAHYVLPTMLGADSFWDDAKLSRQSFLILETDAPGQSAIGPALTLDTASLNEQKLLHIKYAILSSSDLSSIREQLATYLHLTSVPKNLEFPILIELDSSKRRAVKIIRTGRDSIAKFFFSLTLELRPTPSGKIANGVPLDSSAWLPEDDLYGAVSYIMMNEVALNAMISPTKVADLRAFLSILIKYIPFRTTSIIDSLKYLQDNLASASTPAAISSLDWMNFVRLSGLPKILPWKHCKGSKPQFRGYPCSLWLLFHTITANAASKPGASDEISVVPAIRGYIESFFGCRECAEHFINATSDYSQTPNSGAHLLLWRAHNKANGRLAGAISEDPKSPKIQFPSKSMCLECYKQEHEADGSLWDEEAVSAFLLRQYSSKMIIPMDIVESDTNNYSFLHLTSFSFSAIGLFIIALLFVVLLIGSKFLCTLARCFMKWTGLARCLQRHKDDLLPRFVPVENCNNAFNSLHMKQV